MMTMQLQMYRSEMNFSDIDAGDYDSDLDMTDSAPPVLDEVRSLCGLSDEMMDDMRDMVLY